MSQQRDKIGVIGSIAEQGVDYFEIILRRVLLPGKRGDQRFRNCARFVAPIAITAALTRLTVRCQFTHKVVRKHVVRTERGRRCAAFGARAARDIARVNVGQRRQRKHDLGIDKRFLRSLAFACENTLHRGKRLLGCVKTRKTLVVLADVDRCREICFTHRIFFYRKKMSAATYFLIYDAEQLRAYYRCFVQHVATNVQSYCSVKFMLQSRRKYNSAGGEQQSKCTVTVLRRVFDLTNTADEFVNCVSRFQVHEGLYTDKNRDGRVVPLPSEALVLYVTSNALSRIEATKKVVKKIVDNALYCAPVIATPDTATDDDYDSGDDEKPFFSLDKEFYTQLHKSPETKMQRLDVDTQDLSFIARLDQLLTTNNADIIFVIRTPNGYHYVLRSGPVMQQLLRFCEENKTLVSADRNGMNALPGTLQGGRPVQLIYAKGDPTYCRLVSQSARAIN